MNILCLYDATQTFTNTLFEYLYSLGAFSAHRYFYAHTDRAEQLKVDLERFDAICIHYSVRLPFDHLSSSTVEEVSNFKGLKYLFIQDEYDHTFRAQYWIKTLGVHLVFTCVPQSEIVNIYPPAEFPTTRFVSVLTGYIPLELDRSMDFISPSRRSIVIGYRTRNLPIRYGKLGIEKVKVGSMVKEYCIENNIPCDIEWGEEKRLYGASWNIFLSSCRSMLGSESGCNVFDWEGTLDQEVAEYRKLHPHALDNEIYGDVIQPKEIDGLMNQISPKIFEAIATRTVLVLLEGEYSGVLTPSVHYIPLRKDGSNLSEVHSMLEKSNYVDQMAERAYQDIILSGRYTYKEFVRLVDEKVDYIFKNIKKMPPPPGDFRSVNLDEPQQSHITTNPIRTHAPGARVWNLKYKNYILSIDVSLLWLWMKIPTIVKNFLRPFMRMIMRIYRK